MPRIGSLRVVLAVALLATSLPGPVTAQATFPYDETDLVGVTWTLTSYLGEGGLLEAPDGVAPTLLLENGDATGSGGCNSFSTTYSIDSELTVWIIRFDEEIARTLMHCEGPAQSVEEAYLALLPTIVSWTLVDGNLHLNDASEEPVLVFASGTAEEPEASGGDLGAVLAQLQELSGQLADLQARVASLEEAGSSGGSGQAPTRRPRAPAAIGDVDTAFPSQDPDPDLGVVEWQDRSDDEAGFHVYARRGFCALRGGADPRDPDEDDFRLRRTRFVRIARLAPDTVQYRPRHEAIEAELPDAPRSPYSDDEFYDVYVSAYNSVGESRRARVGSYFLTPEFTCP
ncbi:hypothetical protein BH23CHL8_BH23CHL8_15040 [soil metagenome]